MKKQKFCLIFISFFNYIQNTESVTSKGKHKLNPNAKSFDLKDIQQNNYSPNNYFVGSTSSTIESEDNNPSADLNATGHLNHHPIFHNNHHTQNNQNLKPPYHTVKYFYKVPGELSTRAHPYIPIDQIKENTVNEDNKSTNYYKDNKNAFEVKSQPPSPKGIFNFKVLHYLSNVHKNDLDQEEESSSFNIEPNNNDIQDEDPSYLIPSDLLDSPKPESGQSKKLNIY
uniref:Uncharacterized protein n=1 Tax=Meloidogyne incognita TaxID=6306 RepID=A0A914MWZ3_MELIC